MKCPRFIVTAMVLLSTHLTATAADKGEDLKFDAMVKRSPAIGDEKSIYYGRIELRHQFNSYYDGDGYLLRQEPALQMRGRIGASLYQGLVDVYATAGVVKMTETLQLVQRRPEVAIDIYPISNEYILVNQYHLIELPFSDASYDVENANPQRQGSIYRPGVTVTTFAPVVTPFMSLQVKAGVDVWTEVYSRRQYLRTDDRDQRFALVKDAETGLEQEISEPSVFTEYMIAVAADVPVLSGLSGELGLYSDNNFHDQDPAQAGEPYRAERESFVKWKLAYKIKDDLQLINDFYRYYETFLGEDPQGEQRRYRNILRLVQSL